MTIGRFDQHVSLYRNALFACIGDTCSNRTIIKALYEHARIFRERREVLVLCDAATVSHKDIQHIFAPYRMVFGGMFLVFERLIDMLHARRNLALLPDIIDAVADRCAEKGRIGVYVLEVASELSVEDRAIIDKRIRAWGNYRDTLIINERVETNLIAGFVVKGIAGWSADFSVRGSLSMMARQFTDKGLL